MSNDITYSRNRRWSSNFGIQSSDQDNFDQSNYESLFESETSSDNELTNGESHKSACEIPYVAGHPGESTTCSEQSMMYGDISENPAFGTNY